MSSDKLRFALFGNIYQAKKSASIQKILSCLYEHDAEIYIEKTFYEFLTTQQHIDVKATGVFEENDFDTDFVISMGGDGTLLRAARYVGEKNIPIIGINIGRLGFLAGVLPTEIESTLNDIFLGKYDTETHSVIQVEADGMPLGDYPFALNDIAILKRDNASMISIRTCINDEYLVTYQADGLIISTPTGSTAYSLSNGGPIIASLTGTLCLTPVAPHSLNIRPIVIPDNATISLTVESRSHNFLIATDGMSEKCTEGTCLKIKKAPYNIYIIKRSGQRYFATLREKMMWGADKRE
ncbi:MAG: NAD kinase [Prevotella sp.]|nr:NAD kinase [Prevotella sp.]